MKVQINIIYAPGKGPAKKVYENDKGIIWNSNKYDPEKLNVGIGWFSNRQPKPQDSLLSIEPYCVLPKDYDPFFTKAYKHIFTFTPAAYTHQHVRRKTVEINHPCWHTQPNIDNLSKNWLPWDQRSDEVVFIANNKTAQHSSELYTLRIHLADLFYSKSKFKVSWYGESELKKPYYRGKLDSKSDVLTKVKFSVCTENSYDLIYSQNYFTEKMPDVWMSGAIPIYMGCYNIDDFKFFDGSYMDLRKFVKKTGKINNVNFQQLFAAVKGFSKENYESWENKVKNNLFKSEKLFNVVSFKRVYNKIINTLNDNK